MFETFSIEDYLVRTVRVIRGHFFYKWSFLEQLPFNFFLNKTLNKIFSKPLPRGEPKNALISNG